MTHATPRLVGEPLTDAVTRALSALLATVNPVEALRAGGGHAVVILADDREARIVAHLYQRHYGAPGDRVNGQYGLTTLQLGRGRLDFVAATAHDRTHLLRPTAVLSTVDVVSEPEWAHLLTTKPVIARLDRREMAWQ